MKTVPVVRALRRWPELFRHILVHTGQHFDRAMSDIFFEELEVGPPDHVLHVGAGTHAETTGRVMERFEPLLMEVEPDLVLVPGDVNSTMAAAIAAAKLRIPVGHIEAGLRSFDRTMPEEVNRVVTDAVSDLLFTHSPEALDHLLAEGRKQEHVHAVGNTMIDSLVAMQDRIRALDAPAGHGLTRGEFLVVTLHRPALVDSPLLVDTIEHLSRLAAQGLPVIFPIHPRTRRNMDRAGVKAPGVQLTEPLGYLEFLSLVESSAAVLTDSGGIQEETTYLGVPCFTLRDNTERPITVEQGTNVLLGLDPDRIAEIPDAIGRRSREPRRPAGWDGHAAERLVEVLARLKSFATLT
jgi:UDP-N-acetylglucosamine 2-epimerase (non-hydrolysing)